jgi:hypothetical protein
MNTLVMWDVLAEDVQDLLFYWGPPALGAILGISLGAIGRGFGQRLWNSKLRFLLALVAGEVGLWVFFTLSMLGFNPLMRGAAQGLVFSVAAS